jgi:hypothetical protein
MCGARAVGEGSQRDVHCVNREGNGCHLQVILHKGETRRPKRAQRACQIMCFKEVKDTFLVNGTNFDPLMIITEFLHTNLPGADVET